MDFDGKVANLVLQLAPGLPFSWRSELFCPFSMPAAMVKLGFLLPPTSKTWGKSFIDISQFNNLQLPQLRSWPCNFTAFCLLERKLDPLAASEHWSKYSEKSLSRETAWPEDPFASSNHLGFEYFFLALCWAAHILPHASVLTKLSYLARFSGMAQDFN